MNRTTRTALTAVVACLALAAPAHGQLTVTQDPADASPRDVDAKKVTVRHGERRVELKTRMYRGSRLPDEMWHLVDTHGTATPDFLVFAVVANEVDPAPSVSVRRVDAWPSRKNPYRLLHNGDRVDCDLHFGRKRDRGRLLRVVTGRGCFATDGAMPGRLRVNTFGTLEWGKITDVVPGWRGYGRWTSAG